MHLLKEIRIKYNKTQGELSKELGISQSALSQMEIKDRIPSMSLFLKLVKLRYVKKSNIFSIIQTFLKMEK